MGLAPSRCRRTGLQYCSRTSHTGRQYCAVDSITISSTSRATSQVGDARNSAGLVPTFTRSKRYSSATSTSATTTANIFLCTSIPAMWYGIGLSLWERRACLVASLRVASYRRFRDENAADAQLFGQSRTPRIKQCLGLDSSTGSVRPRRSRRHSRAADFHRLSRARGPGLTSVESRPGW
jgi:hypothetical protein